MQYRNVTYKDADFLYKLLQSRESWENISHLCMPTFNDHSEFVRNHPYKLWQIVSYYEDIGSVYITYRDELAIWLERWCEWHFLEILKNFLRPGIFYNVNPENKRLIKLLKSQNFELMQKTYIYGK